MLQSTLRAIYEKSSKQDGYRVLVDRLWQRGMSNDQAKIDLWLRKIVPSDNLRKWFSHDLEKWDGFKKKYGLELREERELLLKSSKLKKRKVLLRSSIQRKMRNITKQLR